MRSTSRTVILAIVVALTTVSVGLQLSPDVDCVDGCDEGGGAACADCPMCSSARPVVMRPPSVSPAVEPVGNYEILLTVHLSRAEDRGVFHVPRHLS